MRYQLSIFLPLLGFTAACCAPIGVPPPGAGDSGGTSTSTPTGNVEPTTTTDTTDGATSSLDTTAGTTSALDTTGGSTSVLDSMGEGTTSGGMSPCGLGWSVFVPSDFGLEVVAAARADDGDIVLAGNRAVDKTSVGVVLKIDAATGTQIWRHELSQGDLLTDVAANANGIYVTGWTGKDPAIDAFVARISPTGPITRWFSGASGEDRIYAMHMSAGGDVLATGYCTDATYLSLVVLGPDLSLKFAKCDLTTGPVTDLRGWDVLETSGGILLAGQWSNTLVMPNTSFKLDALWQRNFLLDLDGSGKVKSAIQLPSFGSHWPPPPPNVPQQWSNLPEIHFAQGPGDQLFIGGRDPGDGTCDYECVPTLARMDLATQKVTSVPLGTVGGVVTDLASTSAGVLVSGSLDTRQYLGEGQHRAGQGFGEQRLDLAPTRRWAMNHAGKRCAGDGVCSSVESVLVDTDAKIVYWVGSFKSTFPLLWEEAGGDPHDNPMLVPVFEDRENAFVIAQCI